MGSEEVVRQIEEAKSDEEALEIEKEALVQTDNRPKDEDGTQPEEVEE